MGGEFPITAISGDSGRPIFRLEIDEHDQLGAKDTKREGSVLPPSTVGLTSIDRHLDSRIAASGTPNLSIEDPAVPRQPKNSL